MSTPTGNGLNRRAAIAAMTSQLAVAAAWAQGTAPARGAATPAVGGAAKPSRPWRYAGADGLTAPTTPRELRGVWIATVDNIDWPSVKTLNARQQQEEIRRIVARAARLNFNSIVLQVRPACDAIYPSAIEPWSEFLSGRSGRAPSPAYDPLAMWVDEAHRRGILVHAWINPFRARHPKSEFPDCPGHISRTHPQLVRKYDSMLWLDPGEESVHDRAMQVVRDVLTRYDIDGVHIDDYFYPYPKPNIPFDDERTFKRYIAQGGRLERDDWRRDNVNRFVQRLYREVHDIKPRALVGISPFGIWRPGYPAGVKSMDAYAKIFADSRLWLREGWLDYCAPQLYWARSAKEQPFEPLLDWWIGENAQKRTLAPGLYASRVGAKEGASWAADEVVGQVGSSRSRQGCDGNLLFSMNVFDENRGQICEAFAKGPYATQTLVPRTSWISAAAPRVPSLRADDAGRKAGSGDGVVRVAWQPGSSAEVFRWVLWARYGGEWTLAIRPGHERSMDVLDRSGAGPLNALAISASDRLGNEGERAVIVPA